MDIKANVQIWWRPSGPALTVTSSNPELTVRTRVLDACADIAGIFDTLIPEDSNSRLQDVAMSVPDDGPALRQHAEAPLLSALTAIAVKGADYVKPTTTLTGLVLPEPESTGPNDTAVSFSFAPLNAGFSEPYYYRDEQGRIKCRRDYALLVNGRPAVLKPPYEDAWINVFVSVDFPPLP